MYQIRYDTTLLDHANKLSVNIPSNVLEKIKEKIEKVAQNGDTYPHKYLRGDKQGFCKLLWAGFRIMYSIDHKNKTIDIHKIGIRDGFYD